MTLNNIVAGKTFVELSRAIQMNVVHELQAVPNLVCDKSCSSIDTSKYYRYTIDASKKVYWKPKMMCRGRMTDCQDLGSADICEFVGTNLTNDNIICNKY